MSSHPEVLWAQRSSETDETKNIVYLTVNLPDIQEDTLQYDLTPTTISVKVKSGNAAKGLPEKEYAFDLTFFDEIDVDASTKRLTTRSLYLVLRKKEKKAEFWPRLTKEKVKTQFIKTDFSKWVDEDEQDGEVVKPEEDDMAGMGGMGGMPGMGGMGGMGGMPGMGGMGGMEGMDLEKMMAAMGGGAGGAGGMGGGPGPDFNADNDSDSDDDGPPPLEDAAPSK